MLRLQPFEIAFPKDLAEAAHFLSEHGANAKICAGGTDLLPNMKHELHEPKTVLHLSRIKELRGVSEDATKLRIGAMTTLHELASNKKIGVLFRSLQSAARHIASPQIRNMGTIGGNLCLDTRCLYYNQSYFWREAIGFCLKKCGDTCHVTKTGKRCVAAASNDTATALLCLDASVEMMSSRGVRRLPLDAFYVANGEHNNQLLPDEILTTVYIPKSTGVRKDAFVKLRNRDAIDFPMLSVAVTFDMEESKVVRAKLAVNALAAKPKLIDVNWMVGQLLDENLATQAGEFAKARCMPLTNICDDPKWRKDMVAVYVKKAVIEAASSASSC